MSARDRLRKALAADRSLLPTFRVSEGGVEANINTSAEPHWVTVSEEVAEGLCERLRLGEGERDVSSPNGALPKPPQRAGGVRRAAWPKSYLKPSPDRPLSPHVAPPPIPVPQTAEVVPEPPPPPATEPPIPPPAVTKAKKRKRRARVADAQELVQMMADALAMVLVPLLSRRICRKVERDAEGRIVSITEEFVP